MTSFSIDNKIETVNTKFTTSILTETIARLTLLQCADIIEHQRKKNKNETTDRSQKFAADVNNIKSSLRKVVTDLEKHQNFTDFSGVSIAENESNFLDEYGLNKIILQEHRFALQKLEDDIASHRTPVSTVDESILKCAMQNRFNKTFERARKDQNVHFYRMLVDSLQNEIDEYARKTKFENRCILEIENYSLAEMEMHKEESQRWTDKFDFDLNKTEVDIQVSIAELDRTKMKYASTVDLINYRVQEMIDFVALKEERAMQKDSDLMKLISQYKDHLFAKCQIFSELL